MDTTSLSTTLTPLPPILRHGLIGVATLGFMSFFASVSLFFLLGWRLIVWARARQPMNQFVVLIFNLVLADIQQSLAFLLQAAWLAKDSITVGTTTCWAQAWFVSTGDLSSGVWCLAIGVHTFSSVVLNYRLGTKAFIATVIFLWAFVYGVTAVPIALHPHDVYARAGAWCWIDSKYSELRLYTHYLFIFIAEFGVVLVYGLMYLILSARIKSRHFTTPIASLQAHQAAKLMVAYPIVYVVCTLPLASARMAALTGHQPSYVHFCIAGAMITSNGWLDVILYTLTRRIMLFSDTPPEDLSGLATFQVPFSGAARSRFGTTTTIQALHAKQPSGHDHKFGSDGRRLAHPSRQSSTEQLFRGGVGGAGVVGGVSGGVKTETTVEVHSAPMELEDMSELKEMAMRARPEFVGKEDAASVESKTTSDRECEFDLRLQYYERE